ncbi:MAG: hypothetical protein AMXMBFR66_26520 [Pseudomonadota bacterium]|nr:general secretion pathway protein GspB [Rubrivivax sp.]
MSYILEALRRAERERERGQVPGLHDQTLPPIAERSRRPRLPLVAGVGLVAAAGAAALLALGWRLGAEAPSTRGSAAWTAMVPAASAASSPARAADISPAPPAAPSSASGAGPAAPALAAAASAVPAGPLAAVRGRREAPRRHSSAAPVAAVASGAARPTASSVLASSAQAASAAAAPSAARAVPLAELSPAERAELPPLAIGGAVYSESAASRFVLVNGQVVHEGEAAAPGVTLERIGPRSAVLRWRERRIELPL